MTAYSIVKNYSDKKLEEFEMREIPLSERYARLSGMLEMNVVTLLDYIRIYHGDDSFNLALDRISLTN